jgi:hypothetical protein
MIPKVAKSGRSFKGAAQYYLHDKQASTADRVQWTHALNLPTDDPRRAIAHMIDTATHADELKAAAGLTRGRKLQKPVYCYSLAWHPDQAPTMAEQMDAAKETIKVLGLDKHQALIVAHNDTKHPHVHIIANRVDPETGKALVMKNDQLKLSKWAQEYELKHGKILCDARVQNNAERDKGKWKKHNAEKRREHYEWKKATTAQLWAEYRAEKESAKDSRKPQYEALWQQRENRIAFRKSETKQLFKPLWRDMFKRQKKELAKFDNTMADRFRYAMKQEGMTKGKAAMLSIFAANTDLRIQFMKDQEQERKALGQQHMQTIRDASKEVHKAYCYDRDQLRDMHRTEDKNRLGHYKDVTGQIWKDGQKQELAEEQKAPQRERVKRSRKRVRSRQAFQEELLKGYSKEEVQKAQREAAEERKAELKQEKDLGRKLDR